MRLLIVSQWFPYPPINGAKQRAYNLIHGLAEKHEVHLLTFSQQPSDMELVPELLSFCRNVAVVPGRDFHPTIINGIRGFLSIKPRSIIECRNRAMERLVSEHTRAQSYDAAIALTTAAGNYLAKYSIPKILDDDNVDFAYFRRLVDLADGTLSKFRRKLTWVKLACHEAWLVERFDATTVVSEEDGQELSKLVPQAGSSGAIHVVPNGVDLSLTAYEAPPLDPRSIISTGALTYNANLDGAVYFCEDILPKIRAEAPETKLFITGGCNGVDIPEVVSKEATLTGFLEDIRPKLAGSAALVVPLRIGGGTRLKILEAMALGTPVVSTSLGAAGLDMVHEQNGLIADNPEEFADCVMRLMRDGELRARISANGRQHVISKFGWQRSVKILDGLIQSTAGREN